MWQKAWWVQQTKTNNKLLSCLPNPKHTQVTLLHNIAHTTTTTRHRALPKNHQLQIQSLVLSTYIFHKTNQKNTTKATILQKDPWTNLSTFTPDPPSQLNIFRHNGNTLGMDGTKIGVLEQTNKVSFSCFLQCQNSVALETQISLQQRKDKIIRNVFIQ